MATQADVARLAGVSTATVSHVLNGTRFVRAEVAERVRGAVAELRYQPNTFARGLRSRRAYAIGLVIPDIKNAYYTEIARAVQDSARRRGYQVIVANSDEDPAKELQALRTLAPYVDGLLVNPSAGARAHLEELARSGPRIVLLNRDVGSPALPVVGVDHRQVAAVATAHLAALGHRRIGVVASRFFPSALPRWLGGYRAALDTNGIPFDPDLVREEDPSKAGGRRAAASLLALPRRPTALVGLHTMMTLGMLLALRDLGLRCPEDVALVGYNDHDWAEVIDPPLTCVAQPSGEMGRLATDMLLDAVERGDEMRSLSLPVSLVRRRSCGCRDGTTRCSGGALEAREV